MLVSSRSEFGKELGCLQRWRWRGACNIQHWWNARTYRCSDMCSRWRIYFTWGMNFQHQLSLERWERPDRKRQREFEICTAKCALDVHQSRGAEEWSVLLPITRPDCSCTRLHSRYANSRFIFRHGNWTKNRPACTNFELQLPTTSNKICGYNILPARELNPELVNESNWSSKLLTHVVPLHQRGLIILKCFTFIVLIPCYSLHPQKDQQT